jgi:hypothetical protein
VVYWETDCKDLDAVIRNIYSLFAVKRLYMLEVYCNKSL